MAVRLWENTNDTIIAYSNKGLYDLYTETHVRSSKNAFLILRDFKLVILVFPSSNFIQFQMFYRGGRIS